MSLDAWGWTGPWAVLRGLAEGATTTRVSLARTAALPCSVSAAEAGPAITGPEAGDFAASPEQTPWGRLLRLRPPAAAEPAAMHWDRPACRLNSAEPRWT